MANLKEKTIFISGGSRGIGLAIAKRAAEDGANIIIAAKQPNLIQLYPERSILLLMKLKNQVEKLYHWFAIFALRNRLNQLLRLE